MDYCSYFIENKALFGSYPTQERVDELENQGVRYFINLTFSHESKIVPYVTRYSYMNFPIIDGHIPTDWKSYAKFIIKVSNIITNLKDGELLFLSCKGGNGRSGVVVASILCYMFGYRAERGLELTSHFHSKRSIMRERWRKLGSPQTLSQKNFVIRFFEPIMFFRPYNSGYIAGFSTFTDHTVETELGKFYTAEGAIQAYKNPTDQGYVQQQIHSKNALISRNIGRKTTVRSDWLQVIDSVVYKVLRAKFDQHPDIKVTLMNTCLRPIIYGTHGDSILGIGPNGNGMNLLGKNLVKIRNEYFMEEILATHTNNTENMETAQNIENT